MAYTCLEMCPSSVPEPAAAPTLLVTAAGVVSVLVVVVAEVGVVTAAKSVVVADVVAAGVAAGVAVVGFVSGAVAVSVVLVGVSGPCAALHCRKRTCTTAAGQLQDASTC